MKRLKSLVLGLAALAALVPVAEAQYYYQPAPRYHPGPQYYPQPYHGPQYYEDYRPRRPVRQPYSPYIHGAEGWGRTCITGRGPCVTERYAPIGTGCRCKIDGLRKGGYIGY